MWRCLGGGLSSSWPGNPTIGGGPIWRCRGGGLPSSTSTVHGPFGTSLEGVPSVLHWVASGDANCGLTLQLLPELPLSLESPLPSAGSPARSLSSSGLSACRPAPSANPCMTGPAPKSPALGAACCCRGSSWKGGLLACVLSCMSPVPTAAALPQGRPPPTPPRPAGMPPPLAAAPPPTPPSLRFLKDSIGTASGRCPRGAGGGTASTGAVE